MLSSAIDIMVVCVSNDLSLSAGENFALERLAAQVQFTLINVRLDQGITIPYPPFSRTYFFNDVSWVLDNGGIANIITVRFCRVKQDRYKNALSFNSGV